MKKTISALWDASGEHNISKQIYEIFESEETRIQTFYADFENMTKGKLELTISEFTQEMLSEFIKHIPDETSLKIIFEYNQKEQ